MSKKLELDTKDIEILNILQRDATSSVQVIAEEIGLTNNPCWRRIKRLQESGVINRYSIDINRKVLGLGTTAFVTIRIEKHSASWLDRFSEVVKAMPEILECHRMTGDVDYLMKIAVKDLNHYDEVYRSLIEKVDGLSDVSSTFSMEEIKTNPLIDASTVKRK
ncbi:Lrp/AsnC family transcriptional regulator [Arenicella sp. 4NH20-0111]|uniref:Lrp/AsnC family transcriptional regulator n=1 Tax=Arenicella sp. 4NH20-0111 TaxID=3127648 RepID=UPI00310B5A96